MKHLRVEIEDTSFESHNHPLVSSLKDLKLKEIKVLDLFLFQACATTNWDEFKTDWVTEALVDPILQKAHFATHDLDQFDYVVEVLFHPGVTDNLARVTKEALEIVSNHKVSKDLKVKTGNVYLLKGTELTISKIEEVLSRKLYNPLLQQVIVKETAEYKKINAFENIIFNDVVIENNTEIELIKNDLDLNEFEKMNLERCLALSDIDYAAINKHFTDSNVIESRKKHGIAAQMTDVEIEVIAQTWSEHCKHRIFAADIEYSESVSDARPLGTKKIQSLYKTYIKQATKDVCKNLKEDFTVSVFHDNAGVVRFDDKLDIAIKVETHNSPSALDPFGGAITGILGVNRDILGVGMGAKPVANTDVFCLAPPVKEDHLFCQQLPKELKKPLEILDGVHQGVEQGGNHSGIPTVNGAFCFRPHYASKPLIYCGTMGVMPHKLKSGKNAADKNVNPGDYIVMSGGEIGKDGIHGATFSSLELNENSPRTAVQIGDPLTQKRLLDFTLKARDLELFSGVTDNGAGGLSSSVGEMATLSGGAQMDLALAPVKYPGLLPYELMISESQERMTYSVPKNLIDKFLALSEEMDVKSTVLGEFTDTGFLDVQYNKKPVAYLDLDFLHDGNPQYKLKAHFDGSRENPLWYNTEEVFPKISVANDDIYSADFLSSALTTLLSSPNITSKKSRVKAYDQEVQAATHMKPYMGDGQNAPSDAGVIWLGPHGGGEKNAIAISCGLTPKYSGFDGLLMAQYAIDEAVRNNIALGADPSMSALVDNFCWPDPIATKNNPDGEYKLGQLVRTCHGLYETALAYKMPFVSGKDSMKNDFTRKKDGKIDLKISVDPTLLITAISRVPNIDLTTASYFKQQDDLIYILGHFNPSLAASDFCDYFHHSLNIKKPVELNLENNFDLYTKIFQAHQKQVFNSCHDISDGGAIISVIESTFGKMLGAQIEIDQEKDDFLNFLFGETGASFIVSIDVARKAEFEKEFAGCFTYLGKTTNDQSLKIYSKGEELITMGLDKLQDAYERGV